MKNKKILLIIGFILIISLIAFALYYVFIRQKETTPIINLPGINAPTTGLPGAETGTPPGLVINTPSTVSPLPTASSVASGGLTQSPALTSLPVKDITLTSDGKSINFYSPNEGKFYKIDSSGQTVALSNKTFFDVQKITWSPQGTKSILEFPDNSKIFYDFNSNKQVTLPKHWEDFSFSNSGNQIAAKSLGLDKDNRWLLLSNPDGTEAEPIFALGNNEDKVTVSYSPAGGIIGFSDTGHPQGFAKKQIVTLGSTGETLNPLMVEGLSFEPIWSTKGDKLVYSTYNLDSEYKPTLWVTNAQGEQTGTGRHKLNVNTWSEKCSFADNQTLYCAVPQALIYGAGFEPSLTDNVADEIYKIDLTTNAKTLIAQPESSSNISSMVISQDKSTLYYTDKNTGLLHEIKLK